jgi:hypothetical protein
VAIADYSGIFLCRILKLRLRSCSGFARPEGLAQERGQLMPRQMSTQLAWQIKTKWPSLPVILISGVNEIPADANIADLFMSKVEGPMIMCQE